MHAVVLLLALGASTWWPADALLPVQRAAQNLPAEADRLFETLALREGMTVGEIGAGAGELTVLIARRLGPAGSVHSTDINADRLRDIRKALEAAELHNVRVIEGGTVTTNLPDSRRGSNPCRRWRTGPDACSSCFCASQAPRHKRRALSAILISQASA